MTKGKKKIDVDKKILQLLEERKKLLETPPKPKEKIKVKSNKYLVYIFSITTPLSAIALFFLMLIMKVKFIYMFLYLIIVVPLFLGSAVLFWIRVYLDRKKIKEKVVKKVTRNFIIANFWQENKQKFRELILLSGDTNSFDIGNETYIIDKEAIYYDNNKYPNLDYLRGIPNPLKYNFKGYLEKYQYAVQSGKGLDKIEDFDKEYIDVSYSSENLKKFKKDKIFSELHSKQGLDGMNWIMLVMVAVLFIIILVLIFKGG